MVDLLLRWGDVDRLVNLSASCPPGPVRTEIIWGLAQARHPQVATYLESEIRDVWAPAFSKGDIYWAGYYWACRKSALRLEGSFDLGPIEEYLERPPEEVREAVEEIRAGRLPREVHCTIYHWWKIRRESTRGTHCRRRAQRFSPDNQGPVPSVGRSVPYPSASHQGCCDHSPPMRHLDEHAAYGVGL